MTKRRDPLAAYRPRPTPPRPLDLAAYRRVRDRVEGELRARFERSPEPGVTVEQLDWHIRREASRYAREFVPFLRPC